MGTVHRNESTCKWQGIDERARRCTLLQHEMERVHREHQTHECNDTHQAAKAGLVYGPPLPLLVGRGRVLQSFQDRVGNLQRQVVPNRNDREDDDASDSDEPRQEIIARRRGILGQERKHGALVVLSLAESSIHHGDQRREKYGRTVKRLYPSMHALSVRAERLLGDVAPGSLDQLRGPLDSRMHRLKFLGRNFCIAIFVGFHLIEDAHDVKHLRDGRSISDAKKGFDLTVGAELGCELLARDLAAAIRGHRIEQHIYPRLQKSCLVCISRRCRR